ncbi:hypothetical protein ml_76 [Mollivirus sibericum]|uniref:hypothetical protein n=1 Tax=Mollivirus sibericum TaxID=1678078 RepID=UPI0006B2E5A7|nr:hypothetical protein ml_76 [Mollivirus sibericum]ALD61878.1 hypothetical protein ml_76 [Mollivirus sibericum]
MKTMVSDRAVVSSGKMLTIGKGLDLGGKKARQESYGRTPKDSVNRAQAEEHARSDGVGRQGDPGVQGPRCPLSLEDVRNLEVIERPFPIVSWYQSSNAAYEPVVTYFEATSFNDVVNFGLTLEAPVAGCDVASRVPFDWTARLLLDRPAYCRSIGGLVHVTPTCDAAYGGLVDHGGVITPAAFEDLSEHATSLLIDIRTKFAVKHYADPYRVTVVVHAEGWFVYAPTDTKDRKNRKDDQADEGLVALDECS